MDIELTVSYFNEYVAAQVVAIRAIKNLAVLDRGLTVDLFNVSSFDATIIHQLDIHTVESIAKKNSNLFSIRLPESETELMSALDAPDLSAIDYTSVDVRNAVISYKEAQLNAMIALKAFTNTSTATASLLTSTSLKDCETIASLPLNKIISLSQRYPWLFSLNYTYRNDIFTATAEVRRHIRTFVESTVIY